LPRRQRSATHGGAAIDAADEVQTRGGKTADGQRAQLFGFLRHVGFGAPKGIHPSKRPSKDLRSHDTG
jgi:hypothetical protein